MGYWPAAIALVVGAAGWWYLFYSSGAARLGGFESDQANRSRVRLRRANAMVMLLLAVGVAVGIYGVGAERPVTYLAVWGAVMALLIVFMILALLDLRLTWRLKEQLRREHRSSPRRGQPPPP